jgi:hypothetical protein
MSSCRLSITSSGSITDCGWGTLYRGPTLSLLAVGPLVCAAPVCSGCLPRAG